jgi:hypothetical protein
MDLEEKRVLNVRLHSPGCDRGTVPAFREHGNFIYYLLFYALFDDVSSPDCTVSGDLISE